LTGDYLKQLQLAKQLEQRTKEAGRNRKESEDRIAGAEAALASAKSFGANVAEAEKLLTEARQSHQQKDYKEALALAQKSAAEAEQSKRARVASMLDSAEELLALVKPTGQELTAKIADTRTTLASGATEDAFAQAQKVWDEAEKAANRSMAESFSLAQSLILLAEKRNLPLENERRILADARGSLEKGNYVQSREQLYECHTAIAAALVGEFKTKSSLVGELREEGEEIGADLGKAMDSLDKAKAAIGEKNFEIAFSTLSSAESDAKAALTNALLASFESLKQRTAALKAFKVDATGADAAIAQGRDKARGEDLRAAVSAWRAARDGVGSLETTEFLQLVADMKPRLRLANRVSADISPVLKSLDLAKGSMRAGNFVEAATRVDEANDMLELSLEGYREVERELARTRALVSTATPFNIDLNPVQKFIEESRQLTMRRDFRAAVDRLKAAQTETHKAVQAVLGNGIMKAEMRVTLALKAGVDVTKESALLEGIIAKVKGGHYEGVQEAIVTCTKGVDGKVSKLAERIVAEAKKMLDTYGGPLEMSRHHLILAQAADALRAGQSDRAIELATSTMETVRRDEKKALELRIEQARSLLLMTREINCESVTLNDKLARAEELRSGGGETEALRLAAEVVNYSSTIIKDELTRQLAQLSKAIASARRNGVEVLQAERLAEDTTRALEKGDLRSGFAQLREAESTLESLRSAHREIYDRIVETSGLIAEADAKGVDMSRQRESLSQAKRVFEGGRYGDAKAAVLQVYADVENLVAPSIAARRVQEAKDLLAIAKRLGRDASLLEPRVTKAEQALAAKQFGEALQAAKEAQKAVTEFLEQGVRRQIKEAKALLAKAAQTDSDVTSLEQVIAKAEALLNERRIYDALRAVELARGELDQTLLVGEKARESIERASAIIADAQEFGVAVIPANELLRQARNYHKLGRHGIALELAKKAGDQCAAAAGDKVRESVRKVETSYKPLSLAGPDLDAALRTKVEIERRIEARKFREAAALVKTLEEEIERVKKQKELTMRSLEETARGVEEAKRKGLSSEQIEALLAQSINRLKEGAFSEAFALSSRCGDELKGHTELYSHRREELEALLREAEELNGDDSGKQVKELAQLAKDSLSSLDFEMATLYLRRAGAAAQDAMETARRRLQLELTDLLPMIEGVKLGKAGPPAQVLELVRDKDRMGRADLPQLRTAAQQLRAAAQGRFSERRAGIESKMRTARKGGADISASESILASAGKLAEAGRLIEGMASLAEAERSIGQALGRQKDYVDIRTKVEAMIENARRNGIDLTEATSFYRAAEQDRERSLESAMNKMKAAYKSGEKEASEFLPDITIDIDFLDELVQGNWAKARIHVANSGKALARDVEIKMSGGLEIRGLQPVPKLRGGEKQSLEVEVMPKQAGVAPVVLNLTCRPVLSNDIVGFESEFEVEAK
jgi:hypothetical protein